VRDEMDEGARILGSRTKRGRAEAVARSETDLAVHDAGAGRGAGPSTKRHVPIVFPTRASGKLVFAA